MKGVKRSLVPILLAIASASPIVVDSIHNQVAPLLSSTTSKEIPNSYIVVFKDHVTEDSALQHHSWVQQLHTSREDVKLELRKRSEFPLLDQALEGLRHAYSIPGGFLGYSGSFDDDVVENIRRHPDVSSWPHVVRAVSG
jgi:cerevisin